MRTPLLSLLTITAFLLAAPSASAVGGACSKRTAERVAKQLDYGDPTLPGGRVGEVLCGAFLGPGSRAMVITEAIPSCGANVGWAVLRKRGGHWRTVKRVRHGAFLEGRGQRHPGGDRHRARRRPALLPVGLQEPAVALEREAGSWPARGPSGRRAQPSSRPTARSGAAPSVEEAWCATRDNQHFAELNADGGLRVCDEDCIQNWDTQAPVLLFGQTVELYGFRCTSDERGITCTVVATGKGFTISQAGVTATRR